MVDAGFLGGEGEVFRGCGGFCCVGKDGKLSVFLENGVVDFADGGITFLSDLGEEFFDVHTVFAEFLLIQLSLPDEDGRSSADEAFQAAAFNKKVGDKEFDGEEEDDGGDGVEKGDFVVEDGSGGDFGEHDGDDEFGDLDFADLSFAHEAHGDDQCEIEKDGADDDGCHGDSMYDLGGFYADKEKNEKSRKKVEKRLRKGIDKGRGYVI